MSSDQSRSLDEVVARAICYTHCITAHPGDLERAESQEHNGWDLWSREAQAVLSAIEAAGMVIVPREPTHALISAMATSQAVDDEGAFPLLMDMIDCSGENKTHTILREAYRAMIAETLGAAARALRGEA